MTEDRYDNESGAALEGWIASQIREGGDPETLALACVVLGSSMLARVGGVERAARTLEAAARDMRIVLGEGDPGAAH